MYSSTFIRRFFLSYQVCSTARVSIETRDSAIQILDRFIAQLDIAIFENPLKDNGALCIGLAAAASVILSSKIHEIRPLCASNFPHFEVSRLVEIERRLLLMIGFQIVPQATPSACARNLLQLWPDLDRWSSLVPNRPSHDQILASAEHLIGYFFKDQESLKYAPSTIALSALLLTFSKMNMDCSVWLRHVPDVCFPSKSGIHPVFTLADWSFLDVDGCLVAMQAIHGQCAVSHLGSTPTSSGSSAGCKKQVPLGPRDTAGTGKRKRMGGMEDEERYLAHRLTPTSTSELATETC